MTERKLHPRIQAIASLAVATVLAATLPTQAATIIGDFEGPGVPAGWGDWADGASGTFFDPFVALPHTGLQGGRSYEYSTTNGVTLGSQSLKFNGAGGFDFSYVYNAGAAGTIADFLANDTISFDITFGGGDASGFMQVHQIAINSSGAVGFHQLQPPAVGPFGVGGSASDQTITVSYDYGALPFDVAPSYLQFLIATNDDSNPTHTTYYLDNVRLSSSIPEPGTLTLLALASLLGVCRSRSR